MGDGGGGRQVDGQPYADKGNDEADRGNVAGAEALGEGDRLERMTSQGEEDFYRATPETQGNQASVVE